MEDSGETVALERENQGEAPEEVEEAQEGEEVLLDLYPYVSITIHQSRV